MTRDLKTRPLPPCFVHPLPSAPVFAGREDEMNALWRFWQGRAGLISIIGPGGAGKTTLTERFLTALQEKDPPDALFVWSFYDEPDPNACLKTAYGYFGRGATATATGAGWFHLLRKSLEEAGRALLVLDGLERVQRTETTVQGIFGELEDPLLRGFLTRLASGTSRTKAIVTSRFPLADVEKWRDQGYTIQPVEVLSRGAAHHLLRSHGLPPETAALDRLIDQFGLHALTLDLLGGALSLFCNGDPRGACEAEIDEPDRDKHFSKLASVLSLYRKKLTAQDMALLVRLCIFRFGVDIDALVTLFTAEGSSEVAGPLSGATRDEVGAILTRLTDCHLVLRDSRGRFTVHPAIRDYFYGIAGPTGGLHRAVSNHLRSLTRRPGVGLPSDKATLDMLEELLHHILQAGNHEEAVDVYYHRMGGGAHLNTRLGEYNRTYRILRMFPTCPDETAMYHCLRAFGRFAEALEWRPQNRYIRIVNGDLEELARDADQRTRQFALFLRGEDGVVPTRSPDVPLPAALLHLARGDVAEARRVAETERRLSMFADDTARQELAQAEVCRQSGDLEGCETKLAEASEWVLRAGSQEHLCLLHLVRARLSRNRDEADAAQSSVSEGLHIARESGFALWQVDLLLELSGILLSVGQPSEAEAAAHEAWEVATAPGCGYAWGAGSAQHALARALAAQGRGEEATMATGTAADAFRRLGTPAPCGLEQTPEAA